jgi:DNA-binding NarL/FixJ family response regulator
LDGIEATRQLAGPDIDDPLAIVVVTTFDLDEYVHGALKAGARAFCSKTLDPSCWSRRSTPPPTATPSSPRA